MITNPRVAKIQPRISVLHDPPVRQFEEQDEATVREIWHTVERNKSLSTELGRRVNVFDTKHPETPIYQIIQTLHATREYESCHCGVTH